MLPNRPSPRPREVLQHHSRLMWRIPTAPHRRGANELSTARWNNAHLSSELVTSKRKLALAIESLRTAHEFAGRASELKTEFLIMVSHELRTPITSLRLHLERLGRHRGDPSPMMTQAALAAAFRSATRLSHIVEGALEYASDHESAEAVRHEPFDLGDLVGEVIDEHRDVAELKGLALDAELRSDVLVAKDRRLVRVVIANLVDNALKFTATGSVHISVERTDRASRVVVEDSGCGIAPGDQERIFAPFEQAEPVRHKHHAGIGLGLTLAKDIAEALGGKIELVSAIGHGSRFTMELPVDATRGVEN